VSILRRLHHPQRVLPDGLHHKQAPALVQCQPVEEECVCVCVCVCAARVSCHRPLGYGDPDLDDCQFDAVNFNHLDAPRGLHEGEGWEEGLIFVGKQG
jgi:hypothetical protein